MERTKNEPPPPERPTTIPPEVEPELIQKWKTEHYANWVDQALPALGGETPREASKTAKGRKELENLLRMMENYEAREAGAGQPAYEFSRVRQELGMKD